MNKRAFLRTLWLLAAITLGSPAVQAADEAPPKLAEMWLIEPKPGQGEAFIAGIKAHMALRQEQGDPRAWQAYTPVLGDQLGQVAVRYCCLDWADLDPHREWDAGKPDVQAHFTEHVAPHVASAAHYFEAMDWANSHWSEDQGPYRLFAVTEFQVEPRDADDFDAARAKMSQIALEQGWATDHVWLWASTIGGPPVHSIIIPHRNFASLESGEQSFAQFLADKLGSADAAAELMHEFLSATTGSNFQIWEHQPDLSMPESD